MSELRILVVDDHRVFAGALATVIDAQPDITVVGTSDSVEAAERDTTALDPDVVVLDVDLGGNLVVQTEGGRQTVGFGDVVHLR